MSLPEYLGDAVDDLTRACDNVARRRLDHSDVVESLHQLAQVISHTNTVLNQLGRRLAQGTDDGDYTKHTRARIADVYSLLNSAKGNLSAARSGTRRAADVHDYIVRVNKLFHTAIDHR